MKYPQKHDNNWVLWSENVLIKTFDHVISDSWTDKKTLIPESLYYFFGIVDEEDMPIGHSDSISTLICEEDKRRYLAWGYSYERGKNLGWQLHGKIMSVLTPLELSNEPSKSPTYNHLAFTLTKRYLNEAEQLREERSNTGKVKNFTIYLEVGTVFDDKYYQERESEKAKYNLKTELKESENDFHNQTGDLTFSKSDKENTYQVSFEGDKPKMSFGHIKGVSEGQVFTNRIELGLSGIHTPTQAGIWGKQSEGSASIVLSGGYEDDVDEGDYILYTGQGGRDADSGKQIKDQEFTRGNKGLQLNKEYNHPVRVTRGYQVEHGPDEGYRYDGLYYVTDYERVKGKEGFYVCRFHLQKEEGGIINEDIEHPTSPSERIQYSGNRVKRNDSFAQQIRDLYNNTCQVCKVFLKTPTQGVGISEAAHIKALGKPHNGPDTKANMICLCPNHHAQFDRYSFYIEPETLEIVGLDEFKGQSIIIDKKHKVKVEFFEYQKQQYFKKN